MVVGEKDEMVYIASEECAIRDDGAGCRPRSGLHGAGNRSLSDWKEVSKHDMAIDFIYPEYEVVRDMSTLYRLPRL